MLSTRSAFSVSSGLFYVYSMLENLDAFTDILLLYGKVLLKPDLGKIGRNRGKSGERVETLYSVIRYFVFYIDCNVSDTLSSRVQIPHKINSDKIRSILNKPNEIVDIVI